MIGYFYDTTVVVDVGVSPPAANTLIRRTRIFPLPFAQNLPITVTSMEFLLHVGLGRSSGQGANPVMQVRFSNDGGETWGPWVEVPVGPQGQGEYRAVINRVGRVRNGVCEIALSDPIPWYLIGCSVEIEG